MSTLRTHTGLSLNKAFRATQLRHEWVSKLKNNGKCLSRIANLVQLAPGWDRPAKDGNQLRLQYVGSAVTPAQAKDDMARIQKVLNCVINPNDPVVGLVRLGRISVELVIKFPWQLRQAA